MQNSPFFARFEGYSQLFWGFLSLMIIAIVGLIDYLTGTEISFSLFYLVAIAAISWYGSLKLGILFAFISAATWFFADWSARTTPVNPVILLWNTIIRLGFFLIFTILISALRQQLEYQQALARIDQLTGAYLGRYFHELLYAEAQRFKRTARSFSLAYIDLDNFKTVNDQFGHGTGDEVLRAVVNILRQELRQTDILARLGGDEFVVLLPETDSDGARKVIGRLRQILLAEMHKRKYPVTFSIGVITCVGPVDQVDDLIKHADHLMYEVKNSTKNEARYAFYP